MNIQFFKPRNEVLQKYIDGFYFMSENDKLKSNKYWSFPNNYSIATVCQNAKVIPEGNRISILPSNEKKFASDFYFDNSFSVEIFVEQPRNEITFYFKPLGIHHFIDNIHFEIGKDTITEFNPHSDYLLTMERILEIKNRAEQIEALENYWLSKFSEVDLQFMEEILREIEEGKKINDIVKRMGISRQYFHRMFFKYIGKSPSEYRKTHRFKTIVEHHKHEKKFIALSNGNLFFDQAHFNKDFKELTGINPGSFFKKVDTKDSNFWLYV